MKYPIPFTTTPARWYSWFATAYPQERWAIGGITQSRETVSIIADRIMGKDDPYNELFARIYAIPSRRTT